LDHAYQTAHHLQANAAAIQVGPLHSGLEPFQIDAAHTEPGAVIDALVGFGLAIGMALGTIVRIQSE